MKHRACTLFCHSILSAISRYFYWDFVFKISIFLVIFKHLEIVNLLIKHLSFIFWTPHNTAVFSLLFDQEQIHTFRLSFRYTDQPWATSRYNLEDHWFMFCYWAQSHLLSLHMKKKIVLTQWINLIALQVLIYRHNLLFATILSSDTGAFLFQK